MATSKIVFVCSGNTCRSPLALAAWRVLQRRGDAPQDIQAQSAGISASNNAPAAQYSIDMARAWDEDLSTHRSQLLDEKLATAADEFFVMAPSQAFALRQFFGVAPEKIHLLGGFDPAGKTEEILDPFGGSREAYETCAAIIFRCVEGVADFLKRDES